MQRAHWPTKLQVNFQTYPCISWDSLGIISDDVVANSDINVDNANQIGKWKWKRKWKGIVEKTVLTVIVNITD